jgi:hypothetical protein
MKKTLKQTIIVCVVINLTMTGFTFAQDVVSNEALKEKALAVRKEADAVRKEADAVRKEASIVADMARISIPGWQYSRSGSILVIPAAEMKVENLAAVTEDMSVMSRIFDNKISQANLTTEQGKWFTQRYNWLVQGGGSTTEAIYLEGYGALFLLRVNMLLSAPPAPQQEEKTEEADTDPVWAQMRRQMYEPQEARRSRTDDRPEEKYDAEKVETLKTNLIKTLKHAANIRALKSDQLVILTVIGDGSRSGANITRSYIYGRRTDSRRIVQTLPEVEADSLQPTVLTICAKKSDIDAFAKGEIDYDQFRKRTGIFKSYAKAGHQASPGVEVHQVAHEVHDAF